MESERGGGGSFRRKRGQFFVFAREIFGREVRNFPRDGWPIPSSSQIISKFGRNRISVR